MIQSLDKCISIQHHRMTIGKKWMWSKAVIRYLKRVHKDDYRMKKNEVMRKAKRLWELDQPMEEEVA